jgi:hypothetical protein
MCHQLRDSPVRTCSFPQLTLKIYAAAPLLPPSAINDSSLFPKTRLPAQGWHAQATADGRRPRGGLDKPRVLLQADSLHPRHQHTAAGDACFSPDQALGMPGVRSLWYGYCRLRRGRDGRQGGPTTVKLHLAGPCLQPFSQPSPEVVSQTIDTPPAAVVGFEC